MPDSHDQPDNAAKAKEIGQMVQPENGVQVACDAIEQQLKNEYQINSLESIISLPKTVL
jgi:hypothetical protein